MEKVSILRRTLGDFRKSGGERLFHCPNCKHHKNKLSVNIDKDKFQCWHCNYSGKSVYRLIRRFGTFSDKQRWAELSPDFDVTNFDDLFGDEAEEREQVIDLPNDYIFLGRSDLPMSSLPARHYLAKRGITMDEILFWKIGYCPWGEFKDRIIVPSFNKDGDPNFFSARTYTGSWAKYRNPDASKDIIFNEEKIIENQKKKWITAVVLGCTELPLAITQDDISLPEYNANDVLVHTVVDKMYKIDG